MTDAGPAQSVDGANVIKIKPFQIFYDFHEKQGIPRGDGWCTRDIPQEGYVGHQDCHHVYRLKKDGLNYVCKTHHLTHSDRLFYRMVCGPLATIQRTKKICGYFE